MCFRARQFRSRYENKWNLSPNGRLQKVSQKKAPPPYNVTIYKGTNNAAISRAFALFFLHSNVSRELMDYFADTYASDEFLWPTLNRNGDLEAPGGYFGEIALMQILYFGIFLFLWHVFLMLSLWLHAFNFCVTEQFYLFYGAVY